MTEKRSVEKRISRKLMGKRIESVRNGGDGKMMEAKLFWTEYQEEEV